MKKLFLSAFAIIAFVAISFGQTSAPASAVISSSTGGGGGANKMDLIQGLDFGTFSITGAGTISISEAGLVSQTGLVSVPSGAVVSSFNVSSLDKIAFYVTLPGSIDITTGGLSDNAHKMEVTNFVTDAGTTAATQKTIAIGGSALVQVGATLHIDGSEIAGSYSGSYDVTCYFN